MEVWRSREPREAADSAVINIRLRLADCFALRTSNNERFFRIAGTRHFHEAIVMAIRPRELDVEVITVWKGANGS